VPPALRDQQTGTVECVLVFFALLGGVEAFGVMGLFIGPVVLSFTHVVLEMLRETNLDQPTAQATAGRSAKQQ
jgi:predicted PurR-regulated permease PerM